MYKRKTKDVYFIIIKYPYCDEWERVDWCTDYREARALVKTYRENEVGANVRVHFERVPIDVFDRKGFSPIFYDKPLRIR